MFIFLKKFTISMLLKIWACGRMQQAPQKMNNEPILAKKINHNVTSRGKKMENLWHLELGEEFLDLTTKV